MESSVATMSATQPAVAKRVAAMPWYCYALVFGATSIVVGALWDISWHSTIGRDSFWTPAHIAIHLGGIVPGLASAWLVLKTTFAGTSAERAASVRFWGFRGPLGAWVCIWGALAMVTSAPFDDWWHNAYGLDVEVLSPPHVLLATGIMGVILGALLIVVPLQNNAQRGEQRMPGVMVSYAAGVLLTMIALMAVEYSTPNEQHQSTFYKISCAAYPLILVAAARASKLRWGATVAAAVYMGIMLAMVWILPRFPATPMLAPIYRPLERMAPPAFPLLFIFPALVIDLLNRRLGCERDWLSMVAMGAAFFGVFFVVQWFFSEFMLTPHSRNWFFAGDRFWTYMSHPGDWQYRFWRPESPSILAQGLGVALLFSFISVRIGLWWGNWMERVKR
jgi:hypothetical protein